MTLLSGLRVLELSDGLTDLGGRMLAELGAEVICVVGDAACRTDEQMLAWHHGKTRIALDTVDDEALGRLLDDADIVLDGRRQSTLAGIDNLVAKRPNLVHVVVRPFSPDGPYRDRKATDLTLMAQSGLMTIVGEPDRPPLKLPGEQAYALTGIQAATAALMGLYARRQIGKGQRIDVSALQSATLANYREAIMYEWTGRIGNRTGNRLVRGKSGVRQVWPCGDGFVTWSMIDNPSMMRAVVRVLAQHGAAGELAEIDWGAILVADEDQAIIDRWQEIFGAFFAKHTKAELAGWSLEHGWGLSAIADVDEVLESNHLAERGLFVDVTDVQTGKTTRLPGPLFRHGSGADAPERRLTPVVAASRAAWRRPS